MANKSLPHLIIVTIVATILGLLTAILLPLLFVVWLQSWLTQSEPDDFPQADDTKGDGDLSPIWDEDWIDELEARLTG